MGALLTLGAVEPRGADGDPKPFFLPTQAKEIEFRADDPMLQDRLPKGTDAEIEEFIQQTSPALTPTEARFFRNSLHWLLQANLEAAPGNAAAARHATYAQIGGLTYLQAILAGYELRVARTQREYTEALKRKASNEAVLAQPAGKPEQKAQAEANLALLEKKLSLLLREFTEADADKELLTGHPAEQTGQPRPPVDNAKPAFSLDRSGH